MAAREVWVGTVVAALVVVDVERGGWGGVEALVEMVKRMGAPVRKDVVMAEAAGRREERQELDLLEAASSAASSAATGMAAWWVGPRAG
jgi:hypothetical protein